MAGVVCAWLRNDLRLHDSPVLQRAAVLAKEKGIPALPVYVIDPRLFQRTRRGTWKTGPFRALFLLQSLRVLRRRLCKVGSNLLVKVGRPEEVLPSLLGDGSYLLTQQEVTSEELAVDGGVREALGGRAVWEYCWGSTLFHKDDLPFRPDLSDAPDVFTTFKNAVEPELAARVNEVPGTFQGKKTESKMRVRRCLPDVEEGSLPLPTDLEIPEVELAWADLPYSEAVEEPVPTEKAALQFVGGEEEALKRLKYYLWDTDFIAKYFDIRNGMLGGDYSTKLAAWLTLGCISPRKIFEEISRYEKARTSSKSTYWVLFELMWRDFFRFFAAKHGDGIFRRTAVAGGQRKWADDPQKFELWATGRTGYPLVDANMRELQATGFMSNRGRQNVASFLALDLDVDWRRGADLFESFLIDYDVTANWGNWLMAAGLGTGRVNRFNVIRQSKMYDEEGAYIRHWIPELAEVPTQFIHQPWMMSSSEREWFHAEAYPRPCVDPNKFRETPEGKGKGGNMKRKQARKEEQRKPRS